MNFKPPVETPVILMSQNSGDVGAHTTAGTWDKPNLADTSLL